MRVIIAPLGDGRGRSSIQTAAYVAELRSCRAVPSCVPGGRIARKNVTKIRKGRETKFISGLRGTVAFQKHVIFGLNKPGPAWTCMDHPCLRGLASGIGDAPVRAQSSRWHDKYFGCRSWFIICFWRFNSHSRGPARRSQAKAGATIQEAKNPPRDFFCTFKPAPPPVPRSGI